MHAAIAPVTPRVPSEISDPFGIQLYLKAGEPGDRRAYVIRISLFVFFYLLGRAYSCIVQAVRCISRLPRACVVCGACETVSVRPPGPAPRANRAKSPNGRRRVRRVRDSCAWRAGGWVRAVCR